jgi:hypothetical protein
MGGSRHSSFAESGTEFASATIGRKGQEDPLMGLLARVGKEEPLFMSEATNKDLVRRS